LRRSLVVRGPVDPVSCHLVLEGNADHRGGSENAILDVNLHSGAVTAAILSGGHNYLPLQGCHGRSRLYRQGAAGSAAVGGSGK